MTADELLILEAVGVAGVEQPVTVHPVVLKILVLLYWLTLELVHSRLTLHT